MVRRMTAPRIDVRLARERDAAAVAAIYAPIVRETVISFEIEPPTASEMAERIATTARRYPWLLASAAGEVIGYAYAGEHRQRAAYRWSADVSAYIAAGARRQGVGRRLYQALFTVLRAQRLRAAFAGITLPNPASVGLHEALGFEPVGVYRKVGFKLGAWQDVGWWRLGLIEGAETPDEPPAEPITLPELLEQAALADILE